MGKFGKNGVDGMQVEQVWETQWHLTEYLMAEEKKRSMWAAFLQPLNLIQFGHLPSASDKP